MWTLIWDATIIPPLHCTINRVLKPTPANFNKIYVVMKRLRIVLLAFVSSVWHVMSQRAWPKAPPQKNPKLPISCASTQRCSCQSAFPFSSLGEQRFLQRARTEFPREPRVLQIRSARHGPRRHSRWLGLGEALWKRWARTGQPSVGGGCSNAHSAFS